MSKGLEITWNFAAKDFTESKDAKFNCHTSTFARSQYFSTSSFAFSPFWRSHTTNINLEAFIVAKYLAASNPSPYNVSTMGFQFTCVGSSNYNYLIRKISPYQRKWRILLNHKTRERERITHGFRAVECVVFVTAEYPWPGGRGSYKSIYHTNKYS